MKKAKCVDGERKMMYVRGKRENRKHPPARDANTTSSASLSSPMLTKAASRLLKICSSGQIPAFPVPRASSALFNKVDVSGWVDDEAFCCWLHSCCHYSVSLCCLGSLAEWSCLRSMPTSWGAPVFWVWGTKLLQSWQGEFFFAWLHSKQ